MKRQVCARRAFTLVELIVVIAIIGTLAAMMFPAIQEAIESSRKTQCKDNLRQIGIALHSYHEAHRTFPPGWTAPKGWAWSVYILPHLELKSFYEDLNINNPNADVPDAGSPFDKRLNVYICPSDNGPERNPYYSHDGTIGYYKSNYPGVHGFNNLINPAYQTGRGIFGLGSAVSIKDIKDGTATTFLVGERRLSRQGNYTGGVWIAAVNGTGFKGYGASVVGTCGTRVTINAGRSRIIGFSSDHRGGAQGGAHFLLVDGTVRFISENINSLTFRRLSEIADGSVIGDDDL